MSEKLRPLPEPVVQPDGSLSVRSVATPASFDIRGAVTVASTRVIPVIFVPGIGGSNLKVRRNVKLPEHHPLNPGEAAWRPPVDLVDALAERRQWERRNPAQRQMILHPGLVEVDGGGSLAYRPGELSNDEMRARGWGEIYPGAYGTLLFELQSHLDRSFRVNVLKQREVRIYWKMVMQANPARWGLRDVDHVTEQELEHFARFQYPVYGFGYNWLASCRDAADRLVGRINEIIGYWTGRRHECSKVILVTHSMGGLVARAAAKQIPDRIAGVVHGVMPAHGAPVAYRRIACGTETASPDAPPLEQARGRVFATIAGDRPELTTPVLAVSPGVLQLLPTHEYPRPWLFLKVPGAGEQAGAAGAVLSLPEGDPYAFYRDTSAWYSMIALNLVDPAGMYKNTPGGAGSIVDDAVAEAEAFHKEVLTRVEAQDGQNAKVAYYHDQTYAFYGVDSMHPSYRTITWIASNKSPLRVPLTAANLRRAALLRRADGGAREVAIEGAATLRFSISAPDGAGDDTVPSESGRAPEGKVKRAFATKGYAHQASYDDPHMLLLLRHLIVKIVQAQP